jgi:hypothetical protein
MMKSREGSALSRRLLYFPGVSSAKELRQIPGAALGDNIVYLLIHYIFIARNVFPRT